MVVILCEPGKTCTRGLLGSVGGAGGAASGKGWRFVGGSSTTGGAAEGPSGTEFGASGGRSPTGGASGAGRAEKSSGNPGPWTAWVGLTSRSTLAVDGGGVEAGIAAT